MNDGKYIMKFIVGIIFLLFSGYFLVICERPNGLLSVLFLLCGGTSIATAREIYKIKND